LAVFALEVLAWQGVGVFWACHAAILTSSTICKQIYIRTLPNFFFYTLCILTTLEIYLLIA
ncbi:MAG: hypothetical protein LBC12_07405, partial [Nitrososphaerota archaeon]|nr:hypothetical protein [Nitrososphaerota archaeon]